MPSKRPRPSGSLFPNVAEEPRSEPLATGATILRKFVRQDEAAILAAVHDVAARAPFRQMVTPGGYRMSVAMTNCGTFGWVTDRTGCRYDGIDPESGTPCPNLPELRFRLATTAPPEAGFGKFLPHACLINRRVIGAHLSFH